MLLSVSNLVELSWWCLCLNCVVVVVVFLCSVELCRWCVVLGFVVFIRVVLLSFCNTWCWCCVLCSR